MTNSGWVVAPRGLTNPDGDYSDNNQGAVDALHDPSSVLWCTQDPRKITVHMFCFGSKNKQGAGGESRRKTR